MTTETVYFIQISDSHIGPTPGYANHGALALPAAQRLVDRINQLPFKPDFVIHTGDVVANPHPASYQLANETFSSLRTPIYYVCGNHDAAADIKEQMEMGHCQDHGAGENRLVYSFEMKGYRFLILDTCGAPDKDPQGLLSEDQLALLRKEAVTEGPPLVVFLHHPVLAMDSPWMDTNMLVMNGDEVHQALAAIDSRLRGVFLGHIHQSIQTLRDSVLYVAAPSNFTQFSSLPNDEIVGFIEDEQPGFNFVRLTPNQIMIRQHRFPQP